MHKLNLIRLLLIAASCIFASFGFIVLLSAGILLNHGNVIVIIIAGTVVCVLLLAGIIFFGIKKVIKPIEALTDYTNQIANGVFIGDNDTLSCPLLPVPQEEDKHEVQEVSDLRVAYEKSLKVFHEYINTSEERTGKYIQELHELNGYMKMLMESAPNMFMLVDRKMRIVYCSNSVLDLFGINDFNEIIGKPISTIYKTFPDQAYATRSESMFSRIKLGEEWISEDDVITSPAMGKRSYRIIYRRVTDEKNKFSGIVHILNDVTAVRLEESERRINDILFSTQLPCMVWDKNGNVMAYNDEVISVFGFADNAEFENLNTIIFETQPEFQPDGGVSEEIRLEFAREVYDMGFSRITAQLQKTDGTPLTFAVSAARISWQFDYWLVVYYYDLTDMKAMEAEAKEAEERVRAMLDSTPMICLLRDEKFNIIDCNREALIMFDVYDKNEIIENYQSFYPEFQPDGSRSVDKAREIIRKLLKEGSMRSFEWTFQTARGELFPVESMYVRIQWKDTYRYLSYYRDLRETKANEKKMLESIEQRRMLELQKEAAQAASEAKSQFLANMSHEIRTPMNAVLGMAELLLSENLNKRQFHYVEDIKTSAMALLDIINDILDFSKIQSGKLGLVPVHYNFQALIENIGSMIYFLAKNKNIVYKTDMEGDIPKYLFGDDVRLRQVLFNLLGNAVKFTREGYVGLFIDVLDKSIIFSVTDTGIGIHEEDLAKLFDAFVQADMEKNRERTGSGLGLSITKALVEMMGGQIDVESVYGEGTTFKVEIPKVLGDEEKAYQLDSGSNIIYAPEAKILVVDDNIINLNVIRGLLQLCKIKADTTTSGKQAIELLGEKKYDLVFMDHMMPEMDGIEATKIIREMGIDIPVIALTANAVTGAREVLLAAGMNDFLSKPIIKPLLITILKNWLPAERLTIPDSVPEIPIEAEPPGQSGFWETIEQIEGLSVKDGLDRVSLQKNVYEKSLKIMVREIEKCIRNLNAFLISDDMYNFAIEVHSMKGSLANIGVMALSGKAQELEAAANKNDIGFCAANLPDFCQKLKTLGSKLDYAFSKFQQPSGPVEIPSDLPPVIKRLKSAFSEMDFLVINNEIENLDAMHLEGALQEKIDQIKDAVLVMNYDDANVVIKELLNEEE